MPWGLIIEASPHGIWNRDSKNWRLKNGPNSHPMTKIFRVLYGSGLQAGSWKCQNGQCDNRRLSCECGLLLSNFMSEVETRSDLAASPSRAKAARMLCGTTWNELKLPVLQSDTMWAEQQFSPVMKRFGCSDPSSWPPDPQPRLHHLAALWQGGTPAPFGLAEEPQTAPMDQPLATLARNGSALVPSPSPTGDPSTKESSRANQCPPVRGSRNMPSSPLAPSGPCVTVTALRPAWECHSTYSYSVLSSVAIAAVIGSERDDSVSSDSYTNIYQPPSGTDSEMLTVPWMDEMTRRHCHPRIPATESGLPPPSEPWRDDSRPRGTQ